MKIMITGASGFLGGGIKRRLSKNNEVKAISLRDDDFHSNVLRFNPDIFIHCGWRGGSSYNETCDLKQYENINDGIRVIKSLSCLDKVKFVGFGSFSEYGDRDSFIEENDIENPSSLYGLTKKMFKEVSKDFCKINNFSWLWIRPCYIYGPEDVTTRLIPRVIRSCLHKEALVLDSCESIVDYLYIDDFVEAIEVLLNNNKTGIYNICSEKKYVVKNIIEHIKQICNFGDITYDAGKNRTNFPKVICGSRKKITSETGWLPKTNIFDGLQQTIDYQKQKM